jgi:pullulanase/glycogen debranching enzyme
MKNLFLFPFLLFCSIICAQVTTVPGAPIAADEIVLTLTTTGTNLEDYTGDIYAHTGITVGTDKWQNVKGAWGDNTAQPKLTKIDASTYTLTITSDVYTFYGVATSTDITELSFVFRSSDGSQQTSPDIFVNIFSPDLNINLTSPTNNAVFTNGESITITAASTVNANLELFVKNSSIKTVTTAKSISSNYTFTATGNHILKATATENSTNKEHEISVFVKTTTQIQTKPTGIKNGVTKNSDGTVTFLLLAPQKQDVFLIGDFNDWSLQETYQLKKDGDYFWTTVSGLDPNTEYAYQYFIDYDKKVADPYAEKVLDQSNDQYISATNYPNLKSFPAKASGIASTFTINETTYNWTTTSFTKPAKEKLVIYELLVRDFSTNDSFQAVIDKLDYLQNLGINALELMPVNEFEGNDSWGYNVSQFFALDKAYGTKNKFKELVDKCHQRGIAVIVDVVFNHSYSQCPLLQMYDYNNSSASTTNNPFYNDTHNFAEGGLQFGFDFNHEATITQNYFKDVMSYWIEEYKIDGYRLDFTKGFTNTQYGSGDYGSAYNQTRINRLKDYANYVWNRHGNDTYFILEHLADNAEEKALADAGMMLWGKMTHNYNQNTMGFSSDTDISWGYYSNRNFNDPNLVTYMESHDEERLMYKNLQYGNSNGSYNVKTVNTALSRQELAGLFFFTIPGPKMIWQFGELGYDISIDQNGRTGKKPVLWNYKDVVERKKIYDTWATLIAFKKKHDVFSTSDVTLDVGGLVKRINLKHASNNVTVIGNFDVVAKTVIPNFSQTGTWYEYFTSATKNVTNVNESITLQPGEYRLYSTEALENPLAIDDFTPIDSTIRVFPNPSTSRIYINKEVNKVQLYDITGKNVKTFSGDFTKNYGFDIQELNTGVYFVKIKTNKATITKKIIKK